MPAGRPERWTEEYAAAFAEELVSWMRESPDNLFWQTFVVEVKDEEPTVLSWLQKKFRERKYDENNPEDVERVKNRDKFFQSVKKAEALQELRLSYKAMDNRSVGGACFILKNKHGWADKQEVRSEVRQVNVDAASLTEKSLEELLRLQEDLAE